jgi:hypothetical protein
VIAAQAVAMIVTRRPLVDKNDSESSEFSSVMVCNSAGVSSSV